MSADLHVTQMIIQKWSSCSAVKRWISILCKYFVSILRKNENRMAYMHSSKTYLQTSMHHCLCSSGLWLIWIICGSVDESHWNKHYVTMILFMCAACFWVLRERTYWYVRKLETQNVKVNCICQVTTFLVGVFLKDVWWLFSLSLHTRSALNKRVHSLKLFCKLRFWCGNHR